MSMLIAENHARDHGTTRLAGNPWRQLAGVADPMLDRALAMAGLGAWTCRLSDNRLNWTAGVYQIFGLPLDMVVDREDAVAMYTQETRETLERVRTHAINTGGSFTLDAQIARPDRELRWIRINGEMIHTADGTPMLHGLKQDVTEEKRQIEALRRLAENDPLTGLSNRAVFEERFLGSHHIAAPGAPHGALVLFDLDGFKGINDRFGHSAGDACIKAFAERLSNAFPDALLSARIGGDEFAVVFGEDVPAASVETRVAGFLGGLVAPVAWRGHLLTIGASSGIAVPVAALGHDPEELFVRADTALYASKRAGKRAGRGASGRLPIGMSAAPAYRGARRRLGQRHATTR